MRGNDDSDDNADLRSLLFDDDSVPGDCGTVSEDCGTVSEDCGTVPQGLVPQGLVPAAYCVPLVDKDGKVHYAESPLWCGGPPTYGYWRLFCDSAGVWSLEVAYRPDSGELSARTWGTARRIMTSAFGLKRSEFHMRVCLEPLRRDVEIVYSGRGLVFCCCVWQPVIHKALPLMQAVGEINEYSPVGVDFTCKAIHEIVPPRAKVVGINAHVGSQSNPYAPLQ